MKCYVNNILENSDGKQEKFNIPADYIKDKSLKFKYDEEEINIKIKNQEIIMEKENKDSSIIFDFKKNKKTESTYKIKELDLYIEMQILTKELKIEDSNIYIEYDLWLSNEFAGTFKYQIEIKEV